jgi:hypothetical protein
VTVLSPKNVNVVVILNFIIFTANVCPMSRMMTCVCVSVIYYTFSEIHQYILILGSLQYMHFQTFKIELLHFQQLLAGSRFGFMGSEIICLFFRIRTPANPNPDLAESWGSPIQKVRNYSSHFLNRLQNCVYAVAERHFFTKFHIAEKILIADMQICSCRAIFL